MDNPEKLATYGTQDDMCWTQLILLLSLYTKGGWVLHRK
jgi:hypothetical protein